MLDPSTQRVDPVVVVNPFKVRNESASPLITTSFVPFGENTAEPLALKGLSVEIVTDPLNVEGPETERLLLTVVNPSMTPRLSAVAAPNALIVVAVELRRLNVVAVVVRSPPLRARSPVVVRFPFLEIVN